MDLRECYGIAGGNADSVLQRFRTEERIIKYLSMFLTDQSLRLLEVHLRSENYEEAFRMAHSLKGVCMNLGLLSLQAATSQLTKLNDAPCAPSDCA